MSSYVGAGLHRFRWSEHEPAGAVADGWAHHGIVVTAAGEVITPHPNRPEMLVLDRDGGRLRSWPLPAVQAHGLTLVREHGVEYLWLADNGSVRVRQPDGSYAKAAPANPVRGAASKVTLDGTVLLRLPVPGLPQYRDGDYSPTSVAVAPDGDVWVADGYGQHLVHRHAATGEYRATLDGTSGAGRFQQPHALFIDRRRPEPELLVADRAHARVQVYDLDGRFLRAFGSDYLKSPSAFAAWGDHTVIAELDGRLTVVDRDDRLVTYLGQVEDPDRTRPGWPNAMEGTAYVRPPLSAGRFNSPHGLAVDRDLNLYVSEFLLGGRLVRLEHVTAGAAAPAGA